MAVDVEFLIYVSAKSPSPWREDDDRPPESLEAFVAPIRSYVSAVGIGETDVMGGDYGFGMRRRPIRPRHASWVLTKDRNAGPGPDQIRLPSVKDRYTESQHDKAEAGGRDKATALLGVPKGGAARRTDSIRGGVTKLWRPSSQSTHVEHAHCL